MKRAMPHFCSQAAGLLLIVLAAVACQATQDERRGASSTREAAPEFVVPPGAQDASAMAEASTEETQVLALLDQLVDGSPMTRAEVASALGGVDLLASDQSNRYFAVYAAQTPELDWLSSVELRVPRGDAVSGELLILNLARHRFQQQAVVEHYGPPDLRERPGPHDPPQAATHLGYLRAWGALRVGVSEDDHTLTRIIVAANARDDAAADQ